jgi:hypothetical protein
MGSIRRVNPKAANERGVASVAQAFVIRQNFLRRHWGERDHNGDTNWFGNNPGVQTKE